MGETENQEPNLEKLAEREERKIPVFTVLKSNAILKNIFLIDTPPPFSPSPNPFEKNYAMDEPEFEEILVVGRHPDCNITLEHPSISRFHVRIYSIPSAQSLSVLDLSSVHGTWVSGKKIEPGVRIELHEGDKLQLGGSSRVYRLHWVPLCHAYDFNNPFVPPVDESVSVEEIEEIHQDGDDLCLQCDQSLTLGDDLVDLNLFTEVDEREEETYQQLDKKEEETYHQVDRREEETYHQVDRREEETYQIDDSLCLQDHLALGDGFEGLSLLFSDMNMISQVKELTPLAPPNSEDTESPFSCEKQKAEDKVLLQQSEMAGVHPISQMEHLSSSAPLMPEDKKSQFFYDKEEGKNMTPFESDKISGLQAAWQFNKEKSILNTAHTSVKFDAESQPENQDSPSLRLQLGCGVSIWKRRGKSASVHIQTSRGRESSTKKCVHFEDQSQRHEKLVSESASEDVFASANRVKKEVFTPEKENLTPNTILNRSFKKMGKKNTTTCGDFEDELQSHEKLSLQSVSKDLLASADRVKGVFTPDKENFTPDTAIHRSFKKIDEEKTKYELSSIFLNSSMYGDDEAFIADKENFTPNTILNRSFKKMGEKNTTPCGDFEDELQNHEKVSLESVSKDLLASADIVKGVFTPDKENFTPDTAIHRSFKNINEQKTKYELSSIFLDSSMYGDDEAFTPDKENFTPNTLLLRSMKMGKLEEIKYPKTYTSALLKNTDSNIYQGVGKLSSSYKGDQSRKILQEKKAAGPASRSQARLEASVNELKGRPDRVPLKSLPLSPCTTYSEPSNLENTIRRWTMVVDTASLLKRDSRKALQLMQGLPGTSLIIPRIVIRELDCMKRRNNLFWRRTDVRTALQWIEDCMVNVQWWIHVQSSVEDVRLIAPTPPATPLSQFSEEKEKFQFSSVPFSPCGSLLEIVSPTTEDHILDCALFFRRIRNNELILLSNNVSLRIKAMAEGVLCETAEEFRESLVNPFSDRFLWTDSSPRGPTWSCHDDVLLKEKYYTGPSKKQSKPGESAKGLKLILLHNSQFRQLSSVS